MNEVFSHAKRSSSEVKDQATAAARGTTDDVGGHMIGHRFAQDQGIKNMFPQNANFNNSAFKKMENEWADWITKKGGSVEVDVQLVGNSSRPDKVKVSYQLTDANGNVVREVTEQFNNRAGQTFDRQYF
ncbi:MAG: DNA/RNA non-specific endonuclease [Ottowia sp.]|nr:DNA/RNA non-specific endonuclease [Ottowia sp.]